MTEIPSKYLNTNVKAMLNGGSSESLPPENKTYIFQFFRIFSFLKSRFTVEILVSKEN